MGKYCGGCWCICSDVFGLISSPMGYLQVAFVTFCTIAFAIYPTYGFSTMGMLLISTMLFFTIMVTWCGFKSMFTEPGLVVGGHDATEEEREQYITEESYSFCKKCNRMKPFRAHHCSKCKTCVLKMDHHCPWINNCVGARNQKYFILYLIYVHLGEIFASIVGGVFLYQERYKIRYFTEFVYIRDLYPLNKFLPKWICNHVLFPLVDEEIFPHMVLIVEVFFSLVVAAFVIALFIDQIKAIKYDLTYVEYLKQYNVKTIESSFYDCLVSCMGDYPCWRWAFPLEGKYINAIISKLSNEYLVYDEEDDESDEESDEESLKEKKEK